VATGTSEEVARVSEPVETPASDREPAAVAAATHGALRDAGREKNYPYRLRGLVRDERDQPLAGANVFLAPRRFPVNQVAVTDEKGQFALAFQAHRAALPALLAVEANGLGLGLVEIELVADRDLEIEVAVRRDRPALERLVAERVWGAAGEASVELSVTRSQLIASRVLVETRASSTNQAPLERAAAHERTGGEHDGFWWPLPGGTCLRDAAGEVAQVEALLRRRIEAQVRLTVRGGDLGLELASVEMTHASTESPPGVVRGIVRNDQGAPVAGVDVGWGPVDRASTEAVQTDEQGTFELAGVRTGEEITLRAGGGDLGRASEPVLLLPGEQRIWDPLLDRGNEVRGRLLGPDGRPLAHALVELWKAGGDVTWNDASATDEDGAFAIPNVPAGSFTLLVVPDGSVGGIPARVVTRTQPNDDLGDLVLSPDELAQGTLRVKLLDADGATPRGAEVRVWHDESRRGRFAAEPDEDGVQTLTGLPPGSYRIEAGCELGWRDLGSLWLGPGETQDLGVVRFESPGVFSLDVPGGAEIGQVSRRSAVEAALGREPVESGQMILSRSHSDIDAQVLNGPAHATRHLLAPGWYRLTLGSSSARSSTVFRIWPGVTSSFAWREANGVRELVEADPLPAPALDQASCAGCHTGAGVVGGAPRNR